MMLQLRIALSALFLGTVLSQNQRAVLYDQYDGNGEYIVIPEDYVANLADVNFDNKPKSVCGTGIWLFYQDANFNPVGGRGVEYVSGYDRCFNLRILAGTISSMRFAGPPKDYRSDSMTLYQYEFFQGEEEYILTDLPNLNLAGKHQSIIMTGNSYWTVYDRPNYQGNSLCLIVQNSGDRTPTFIFNLQNSDLSIPHGSIRSIRTGCQSLRNVTLRSFTSDHHAFTPTQLEEGIL